MNKAYLLTGGNLGNRMTNLQSAKVFIQKQCGKIILESPVYETEAWGMRRQPSFYNQVLHIETAMDAFALLREILSIEEQLGRKREIKMGPRIIDIDILFFNNDIIQTPQLTIPHPHLQERRFVLTPLASIAANYIHPVLHKKIIELLHECKDDLAVYKISANE